MNNSCIIIGLGQIGMEYDYNHIDNSVIYTHAHAINQHSNFRLLAAVDISSNQRKRFEECYSLPAYDNIELCLKRFQPDLIVIAVPTELHCSIIEEVIKFAKPKVILCEKPLAYKLDEAKNIVKMCKEKSIKLFVNYMRSVDKGVLEIKKRIDDGKIKVPIKANVWYSKGLYNNGSHFVNLLNFWLGDINSTSIINHGRSLKNFDHELDFKIEYNLGTAIFRSTWEESFSHYNIELLSNSGRLFYDQGGKYIEWQSISEDQDFKKYKILDMNKEIINNSMDIYQWHVYDNIHMHLNGGVTTLCTGSKALKSLNAIDLIIKQIQKR